MQLNPYLLFDGQCETAFKFYERVLGGKIQALLPHAGTPAEQHVPAEWRDKIMHGCLSLNGQTLMASDAPPGHYAKPQGFHVSIQLDDTAAAERIFTALKESGQVSMPLQQTFWAARFGMLTDQFGIPWMINCSQPA